MSDLTRAKAGGSVRGQAARSRVHLVPEHEWYSGLLARRAVCGAEPSKGFYVCVQEPSDADCPRCLARVPS